MKHFLPQLQLTLRRIFASPLAGSMSILVIGIALSLPAGLYVLLKNASTLVEQLSSAPQINLFLKNSTHPADVVLLQNQLSTHPKIMQVDHITPDTALQRMSESTGLSDVLGGLPDNPLPHTLVVTPQNLSAQALDQLQQELSQLAGVELAQLDTAWAYRLEAILEFGRLAAGILTVLLSLALIAITFNTIRLQILTQRDEIEIAQLIGATNSFIRRPFLYYGAVQGLLGGMVAWLIIAIGLWLLNQQLQALSVLYNSAFSLQALSLGDGLSLLLFSMYLGLLGAWLSVLRHLSRIEPR